ncbi:MAG: hypothetical protein RR994_00195 [Clostridia bacterium]
MAIITTVPRQRNQEIIWQSGSFSYRVHMEWGKWLGDWIYRLGGEQLSGLCCDDNGLVYALTRMQDVGIVVFSQEGQPLRTFGAGLFCHAHMMRMSPRGTLWAADDRGHIIIELTTEGKVLRKLGTGKPSDSGYEGSAPWPEDLKSIKRAAPPFNRPTSLFEKADGTLLASDGYANVSVHRFLADGTLASTWGKPGTDPGTFRLPHSVWVDARDRVWIADRENNRIEIFTQEGGLLADFEGLLYPSDFWSDGTWMYVAEAMGGISIFDMDLNLVSQLGHYNSQLQTHTMCGNSKGDLFLGIMSQPHKLVKLERL